MSELTKLAIAAALRYGADRFKCHPAHAPLLADKVADSVRVNPDGSISGIAGGDIDDVIAATKESDEGFARLFTDYKAPINSDPNKLSAQQLEKLSPSQLLSYANTSRGSAK